MSLVRPPTFEELLETYGDPRRVIEHLLESGLTPQEIERRYGIPYHRIRLYMERKFPKRHVLFGDIAATYERIASFRSPKGKETELAKFFQLGALDFETKVRLALGRLLDKSPKVGQGIIELALAKATRSSADSVRKLFHEYGDYGDIASMLVQARKPTLTVDEVCESIKLLPKLQGIHDRVLMIASLLRCSTSEEAKYIIRLILQDLKLGYHEHTVTSAVARALGIGMDAVEGACSILGVMRGLLLAPKGEAALRSVKLRPGMFLLPQLAHLYDPDRLQLPALVEYKFDGSRLQLHKWGTRVWLFSRRAIEKSQTLPEIVEIVKAFSAHSCIVDSEVIAMDQEGRFLPFQHLLLRTVPREYEEERLEEVSLTIRAFDMMYLNGRNLMDLPLEERRDYLKDVVPREYISEGIVCYSEQDIIRAYQDALSKGYEGILVKSLKSVYEAGKRTWTWLKFKPERDSIDCVIVKALYGRGRRAGFFSSFELAVRDPVAKRLYTIGRVSNVPEALMAKLADVMRNIAVGEDREGVYVRPFIVLEVTYQEIQKTKDTTSGFSLRVPKVVRVRDDKTVEDVDTIEKIQQLYEMQYEERFKLKTI